MSNAIRMLRLEEVMSMTGLSRSSIYAMSKQGSFPKQIQIGPRAVRWNSQTVEAWLTAKIEAAA